MSGDYRNSAYPYSSPEYSISCQRALRVSKFFNHECSIWTFKCLLVFFFSKFVFLKHLIPCMGILPLIQSWLKSEVILEDGGEKTQPQQTTA